MYKNSPDKCKTCDFSKKCFDRLRPDLAIMAEGWTVKDEEAINGCEVRHEVMEENNRRIASMSTEELIMRFGGQA